MVIIFAMVNKTRVSSSLRYYESPANRQSIQELLRYTGYENMRIECTEVNWPAPNFKSFVARPNLRNLLLFSSKVLDKSIARLIKNFGSRYFLVCRIKPSERKKST